MGNSLALTLPEIILTLAALALLMVAAYAGDKSARLATWLALAAFVAAALVVPGVFDRGGVGFDGLFIADSFAAFAKILVYIAAAVSLIARSAQRRVGKEGVSMSRLGWSPYHQKKIKLELLLLLHTLFSISIIINTY